jgi:hypothetical protein
VRAGKRRLDQLPGVGHVLAAHRVEVITTDRGPVAGVAEEDGEDRTVLATHLEDGDIRVGGRVSVFAEVDAVRGEDPPVHRELRLSLSVLEYRRLEVIESRADHIDDPAAEELAVGTDRVSLLSFERKHGRQGIGEHWSGVRVGGDDQHRFARKPQLLLDHLQYGRSEFPGDLAVVERHEDHLFSPSLECESLHQEWMVHSLERVIAAGVPREPDRILRGDVPHGHTGQERIGGRTMAGGEEEDEQRKAEAKVAGHEFLKMTHHFNPFSRVQFIEARYALATSKDPFDHSMPGRHPTAVARSVATGMHRVLPHQ